MSKRVKRPSFTRVIMIIILLTSGLVCLYPVLESIIKGAKPSQYYKLLFDDLWFYPCFWNSFFYAGAAAAGVMLIAVPFCFALAKGGFRFKKIYSAVLAVLMLLPLQVTLLPTYIGLRDFGLLDTRIGIVMSAVFSPLAAFLILQYMKAVDDEQIEAARLDTSSIIQILVRVVLPQVKICIGAVFVFVFAENWSMIEQPEIFLKTETLKPLSVMISKYAQESEDEIYAASSIFMLPILLLYFYFDESFAVHMEGNGIKL